MSDRFKQDSLSDINEGWLRLWEVLVRFLIFVISNFLYSKQIDFI